MADSQAKTWISLGVTLIGVYTIYQFLKKQCAPGGNWADNTVCNYFETAFGSMPTGTGAGLPASTDGSITLGVPPGILSQTLQTQLITAARSKGMTDAQIQLMFTNVMAQAAQCGGQWNPNTGSCGVPFETPTGPTTGGTTTPPVPTPPSTSVDVWNAVTQKMKAQAGTNSLTFDQWSYYFQNGTPFAGAPTGYGVGGSITPGMFANIVQLGGGNNNAQITAEQFIAYLKQVYASIGMAGIPLVTGDLSIPWWLIHRGGIA